jgi:O-antigen/teichoic acid export membrane protein
MQKKLLSNIALVIAINLLVKPIWILVIDRGVQNNLGYEAYGQYASMFSIAIILTMLLDFGINNYNSTSIASNAENSTSLFASLLSLRILLSAVYFILTMLLAYAYGFSFHAIILTALLAINQIMAYFSTFFRSSINGLQLFRTDAWISVIDRLVMIILGSLMLWGLFFQTSIENFIYIQTLGYLAIVIVSGLILNKHLNISKMPLKFGWHLLKDILKKTYPYAILSFVMLIYMRLDVLLIKKLLVHGDYENGVFASGGRLLEAANMMMGTIALILLPLFAKQIAEKTAIKPILNLLQSVIILPAIVFSIICSVFASEIIHFVSPESNNYTADVFSILILSFIPFAISHIYGTLLTAKAEIKLLILLSFTALLINLTMNFYLIPKQGAMGAAWSVLTTQMVSGFGSMLLAIKRMKINTSIYESARILLFPFICFILVQYCKYQTLSMATTFLLSMTLMTLWLFMTGMIKPSEIRKQINLIINRNPS